MSKMRLIFVALIVILFLAEGLLLYKKNIGMKVVENIAKKKVEGFIREKAEGFARDKAEKLLNKVLPNKVSDQTFQISPVLQEYKTTSEIVEQLEKWHKESPSLTEIASYGKTANGTECIYFRAGTKDKPKVLIHSGLNGDEEYAILACMNMIENMLSGYNKNDDITWILDNRDIYFIPVFSPDTYLKNEKIEGYNPSTSFPYPKRPNNASPTPIKLAMSLACNMKFKAVINMHTFGESIYGPEICAKEDGDKINALVTKMVGLNGYKTERLENAHGSGNDVDWFYSSGAASIKMLWGKNSKQFVDFKEIGSSVQRSLPALLLFMKEGTELDLRPTPLRTVYYYEFE